MDIAWRVRLRVAVLSYTENADVAIGAMIERLLMVLLSFIVIKLCVYRNSVM